MLIFLLALSLVFFSIYSASPPSVRNGIIPDSSFSVGRAYIHLNEIAKAPHSTGTTENARVRDYIIAACKQLGYEVQVQNTTAMNCGQHRLQAGIIYNVIARKKGLHTSKSVMLMAHYDSEPNTPGAGDNGAGVAAMLETARALNNTAPLQNDLILLFTDGEEVGLLGAHAFVEESPLLKDIGLVINFEGRGNAGPSNMFEVNAQNGWAINEYSKSAAYPFGNALGYEIYKNLPNITDFTLFKNAGITGLNNAYIEGFENYHSPNDKPANLDKRSFQHHGDNMLSLATHFGNLSITKTKAPDVTYFNMIGYWFISYPASWNTVFVMLVNLVFIAYLVKGIRSRQIKTGGAILSTILFPVVLIINYFAAQLLLKFIIFCYPLYCHFDGNNSYNSNWYFLAITVMTVGLFSGIFMFAAKKINYHSLLTGILFTLIFLMNVMQYAIPSASYLLCIPLFFALVVHLFILLRNARPGALPVKSNTLNLVSVLPAIFLFSTTVYFSFVAFALSKETAFVAMGVGLFCGILLPVFYPVFKHQKSNLPLAALACFILALLGGHIYSRYSQQQPLQADVSYQLDADSCRATWLSGFTNTDKWSMQFFKNRDSMIGKDGPLRSHAPAIPLPGPMAVIKKDATDKGTRKILVHFNATRTNVVSMEIFMQDADHIQSMAIDGKKSPARDGEVESINYEGVTSTGFDVLFNIEEGDELKLLVKDRSIGLPKVSGFDTSYPDDVVPGQGSNSNTTQVSRQYAF
ncbi:MAG: M28 family peptidase [Ferruginibacter sp.]